MPRPGNFGDIITPYLIRKMSGYRAVHTPINSTSPFLISIGSIISKTSPSTTVWGSGALKATDKVHPAAQYLAVRGPITRELIIAAGGKCPEVFGDPALILPKVYDKPQKRIYDVGLIPHYVDYDKVTGWYDGNTNIKVINLLNDNIESVVNDMRQCERLVSSSLHGIIVAAAYGIPVSWVKLSDKLYGDGTKFYDFFDSVKVKHKFTYIEEKPKDFSDWLKLPYITSIDINLDPLLKSFPICTQQ